MRGALLALWIPIILGNLLQTNGTTEGFHNKMECLHCWRTAQTRFEAGGPEISLSTRSVQRSVLLPWFGSGSANRFSGWIQAQSGHNRHRYYSTEVARRVRAGRSR